MKISKCVICFEDSYMNICTKCYYEIIKVMEKHEHPDQRCVGEEPCTTRCQ